ncbi:PREDICTED: angiogenic factor with G patch and FHA domains 1-like isoform X2 [Amphimedon queenslandica]|uniref:Uncharacterized protein n=1 Tax=Amphimedon queenslandica TaxID=400682 RepID=A0AAN0J8I3_AMPQE|nr:PREDICTED: angiogenic factor with G patch and FHA domains 1-like isoform X2 [Amphimedon queenslandica]|eukprot:XP_019853330.1 PREDICTED: angiogenic factor with G patch and FHA domains 1-like isoform X2 [Amphimedon queenslandica]
MHQFNYSSRGRHRKPKEASKAYLLQHGDYLKIGGSSFLLHIHHGMASCGECSSMGISVVGAADGGGASNNESLEMQRRKGLNKLKKKYGLRLKDSFGDESYKLPENYTDNAPARRKRYGVELPQSAIRDDSPSTVNESVSRNLDRRVLRVCEVCRNFDHTHFYGSKRPFSAFSSITGGAKIISNIHPCYWYF